MSIRSKSASMIATKRDSSTQECKIKPSATAETITKSMDHQTLAICRVQTADVEAFGPPTSIARPQLQLGQKRGATETPPKELGGIGIDGGDTRLPRYVQDSAF
eukprot:GHVU01223055.1.p3 GENE.GHVU01223055.1~~GHVU01223055.1.p3  ORF type:complete len:104 (-),score=8.89 GHVU01223055.1:140-451(-)